MIYEKVTHPIPNSSQFVFPIICAPAFLSASTTVASVGGVNSRKKLQQGQDNSLMMTRRQPRSIADEQVVGIDEVHILSFTATVML
jgi:hypothetical protein